MSDPLRIAVIAHLRHPVAQPFMGGMEAHADLLVRTLVARGHDVTLFASGDSAPDLPLDPVAPRAYEAELPWALWRGSDVLNDWLTDAYRRCWDRIRGGGFDVVHNNSLFPAVHDWAARDGAPMVTSLHVPPFASLYRAAVRNARPWLHYTVPSHSQRPAWADLPDDALSVAHNGIDLTRWRFAATGNGRAVWLGRITPTKGTVEALRAASAAGIALDVIGPVECSDYFAQVAPLIVGPHRYLGHLSGDDLTARMAAASVMLCTPMWDEPFGLVAAEALACGVPVAALDRGALREVIGNCGALADSPATLAQAIRDALAVSRESCRRRAEELFGADAMVRRYERVYAAAIAGVSPSRIDRTRALLA